MLAERIKVIEDTPTLADIMDAYQDLTDAEEELIEAKNTLKMAKERVAQARTNLDVLFARLRNQAR